MAQMTLPGIGPVDRKYVYVGAAGVLGIVGYVWWTGRQANAGAAATDTPADTGGEAALGDPSNVPATDYVPPVVQTPPPVVNDGGVITDNATWARAAVAALTDVGADTTSAASAIGRYLAGLGLSPAAADLVRQAVALVGNPPVGDHPIKLEPVGKPDPGGASLKAPTGLRATSSTKTTVALSWTPVTGAEYYRVYRKGVATNIGSSTGAAHTVGGLQPNHNYTFHVRGVGHDNKYGPPSSSVSIKTKK